MTSAKPKPPLIPGETRAYPVLPLRDIVVFPHMIVPLFVGREKSIRALEEVMRSDTFILLATQKNASEDDPTTEAIFAVGTLASVLQLLKLPDGTAKVLVEGAARAKILKYTDRTDYYEANAVVLEDTVGERVDRVRRLCEAQQEGLAGGRRRGAADRRLRPHRRHGRLPPGREDPRQAGDSGDDGDRRAAGEGVRP